MGTLKEIAARRKADFRQLLKASRALDAAQESLEREVKRLVTRKEKVPETEDATRVISMIRSVSGSLEAMMNLMEKIAANWKAL